MNIYLSFQRATTLFADREAIVDGDKRFTYAEFGERVRRLAGYLQQVGLKKGSVAAVLAPNCHEMMELYYACAATGIVLNPLNYRLSPHELNGILVDSQARILFLHTDLADIGSFSMHGCGSIDRVVWFSEGNRVPLPAPSSQYEQCLAACEPVALPAAEIDTDDVAYLYYTSGTTGKSKGVMLTHGNVSANALGAVAELKFTDTDVWAHVAPIFHLADAWSLFAVTWVGGKHLFEKYFEPDAVLSLIERESVTVTLMVPTMVNALLHCPALASYDFTSLRTIMTGGAPIAPDVVRKLMSQFGCDFIQLYGMTETSPILTLSLPPEHLNELDQEQLLELKCKTGRPFIAAEVRVVRPDGTAVSADGIEVGEIVARGPVVMKGYLNQPDATAQAIVDSWMHTGDLAVVDQYGYINIVDRQKDMIISGGENIYSTEVEYVLYEHPSVKECAVFGIPHEEWGESVRAVVVLKEGKLASEDELIDFVRARIARYKAPRNIDFVSELPKTGSGKIFKRQLKEKYWQGLQKHVH